MKMSRRGVLKVLAGAAVAVGVPSIWIYRMKTYSGPVSDHFDGMRFFDPDGAPPKSLGEVLRWQFGRDRQRKAKNSSDRRQLDKHQISRRHISEQIPWEADGGHVHRRKFHGHPEKGRREAGFPWRKFS